MSFPAYEETKVSGVEWIGSIPTHWSVVPGRRLFAQKREPSLPNDEQLSATQKYGVLPQARFMELEDQKVTLALSGLENFKHVETDDFVISLRSFQGGIEHSPFTGCVSPAYTILRAREPLYPAFWKYALKSVGYIEALQSVTDGIRDGKNISYEQFGKVFIPEVPLEEQQAIANFLDAETSKIDALVAEQRRLIELLSEKRQAVISHAVTKGLDPNVRMKPSGIEWLGDVPEHWTMKRLKHVSPFIAVGIVVNPSSYVSENREDLPFIYGGDIREGVIDWRNSRRITQQSSDSQEKTRLEPGDLLTVRVGAPGVTAVVPDECRGGNCASVMLMRRGEFNSVWLCYLMNTRLVRFQVEIVEYGAAQKQFNIAHAVNFWVPVPDVDEQNRIVDYLENTTSSFDRLISEAEQAISLLQERRTALISAAVTGKIDVHEFDCQETA